MLRCGVPGTCARTSHAGRRHPARANRPDGTRGWDFLVPARAIENGISIVYANRIGTELELTFIGKSQICGTKGSSRIVASGEFQGLLHAELHIESAPIDYVDECTSQSLPAFHKVD